MGQDEIFLVLGIEKTTDEEQIKAAYRKKLVYTNPEDNPEDFKKLREAYEAALFYIKRADHVPQKTEDCKESPITSWLAKISQVYCSIKKRMDAEEWKRLLNDDILLDLDYGEEAKEAFFRYIMDHFRLTGAVYRVLDEKFHIVINHLEMKEQFPVEFVDYMIHRIRDVDGESEYPYEWFQGDEYADYDSFIKCQFCLEEAVLKEDVEEADTIVKEMKKFSIQHPFFTIEIAKLKVLKNEYDSALELAQRVISEYGQSIKIQVSGAEVLWKCNHIEEAVVLFRNAANQTENQIAKDYLARYYIEKEEIVSMEDAEGFLKACIRLKQPEKGLDFLEHNQKITKHIPDQYKYECLLRMQVQDWEQALENCIRWRKVLEKHNVPNRTQAVSYAYEARIYAQIAKQKKEHTLKGAEQAIDTALSLDKGNLDYMQERLDILIQAEDYEQAKKAADAILAEHPDWSPALAQKQKACFELQEAQETVDLFYQLQGSFPLDPQIYELAAQVFMQYEQLQDAQSILDMAKGVGAVSPKLQLIQIQCLEQASTVVEALKLGRELLKELKEQPSNKELLAEVYHELAVICYNIKHHMPDYEKYIKNGEYISFIKQAIALNPSAENYYVYGRLLRDVRNNEEALKQFLQAKAVSSGKPYLEQAIDEEIGECYEDMGHYDEALDLYKKVLEMNPQHPNVNGRIGYIYEYLMRCERSRYYAEAALEYTARQLKVESDNWAIYEIRSSIYLTLGQFEEALQDIQTAMKLSPENPHVLYNLAKVYAGQKEYKKALDILHRVITTMEQGNGNINADLYKTAGQCSAYLRDWKQAEAWYLKGYEMAAIKFEQLLLHLYQQSGAYKKVLKLMEELYYPTKWHYEIEKLQVERQQCIQEKQIEENLKKSVLCAVRAKNYLMGAGRNFVWHTYVVKAQLDIGDVFWYCGHNGRGKAKIIYEQALKKADSYWESKMLLLRLMEVYYEEGNQEKVKEYAEYFMEGLEEKYAFHQAESPEKQFVDSLGEQRTNRFMMGVYWLFLGDLKKAWAYWNQMQSCQRCADCQMSECSDFLQFSAMLYEAEGNDEKAYTLYREARRKNQWNRYVEWKERKLRHDLGIEEEKR